MKTYQEYSGCVMLDLYNPIWSNYINERKTFNSLYTDFEDNPHLTLLYGIDNNVVKKAHKDIVEFLKQLNYNKIVITEKYPSTFINTRIVSKFNVIGGNIDLSYLNTMLKQNFTYVTKYNEYHPHITICYSNLVKITTPILCSEFRITSVHSSVTTSEGYETIDRTTL